MKNKNHDLLKAALLNFQDAATHLSALWTESGYDLSKDYPFQTSFDEIDFNKWVKTSIRLIAKVDRAKFCMDHHVWLNMTTKAREQLLADDTIETLENEFRVTAVNDDGTGNILGQDGSTFYSINLDVLGL